MHSEARPIYLDHHSTTPVDPVARDAMAPWLGERFGNAASRTHVYGTEARAATERARGQVASLIGASPKEIVFTSGATEADNLAILGLARARRPSGKDHVITVATEHPAVLDPVDALARAGFSATVLPVDSAGLVDPDDVARALRPTTALVSVMAVNNEIGVLQPLADIAAVCRARGVPLHTDAAQSAYAPLDVRTLPVDLVSLSAHKLYGPQGVGALYVRRARPKLELEPLVYGGGHERGLRSGTLPVALVAGFGAAAAELERRRPEEIPRVAALRDRLLAGLRARVDGIGVNGHSASRSPNNLNLSFAGVEAAALLVAVRGVVALSTGSACSSETLAPSHVLKALGLDDGLAQRSVRFGLGRTTTEAEIDRVVDAVAEAVRTLRGYASRYEGGYGPDGG